jgi:hypothetical protein
MAEEEKSVARNGSRADLRRMVYPASRRRLDFQFIAVLNQRLDQALGDLDKRLGDLGLSET